MKRMCRQLVTLSWSRRQRTIADLLRHARIVIDPEKLAYLNAEVKKRSTKSNSNAKEEALAGRKG